MTEAKKLRAGRTMVKTKNGVFLCEEVKVVETSKYGKKVMLINPFFFKNLHGESRKIYYLSRLPLFIENI